MPTPDDQPQTTLLQAYDGDDMAGHMLSQGFAWPENEGSIRSITNVRDAAIIVADFGVWRAKPSYYTGFSLELLARI